MKAPKLPSSMKDYQLKGWPSKSTNLFFPKWGGEVDLEQLTPEKADKLIERGFPYIVKRPQKASKEEQAESQS